jgi:hypothetical protein
MERKDATAENLAAILTVLGAGSLIAMVVSGAWTIGRHGFRAIGDFFAGKEAALLRRRRELETELVDVESQLALIDDGRRDLEATEGIMSDSRPVVHKGAHAVYG